MNTLHSSVIFIVDDDEKAVEMITACLAAEGFANIHGFLGPVDAVDAVEHTLPDLIITGLNMPDANGSFLAKLVKHKSRDRFRWVPVIVITTDPSPNVAEVVIKAGAAAVLLKPIKPQEIILCATDSLEYARRIYQVQQSSKASLAKTKEGESAILLGQEVELGEVFDRPSASS